MSALTCTHTENWPRLTEGRRGSVFWLDRMRDFAARSTFNLAWTDRADDASRAAGHAVRPRLGLCSVRAYCATCRLDLLASVIRRRALGHSNNSPILFRLFA